jgi:hypothetical protein
MILATLLVGFFLFQNVSLATISIRQCSKLGCKLWILHPVRGPLRLVNLSTKRFEQFDHWVHVADSE